MKKRTLITILAVVLSLAIMLTAFACGPKKTPKPKPKPEPEPGPTVALGDAFNAIIKSADKAIDNFAGVEDAAYYAFTGYIDLAIGDEVTKFEVTIKGNFSEIAEEEDDNNSGYIEIKNTATNKVVLAIYIADNTVYIGETFTSTSINWFKLSQAKADAIISGFFAQLPGLIKDKLGKFAGTNFLASKAGIIISAVSAMDYLFILDAPSTFEKNGNTDGDYKVGIVLSEIGKLLTDPGIATLIGSFDLGAYMGVINMLAPMLLGLKVVPNESGQGFSIVTEGVAPEIDLEFSIKDGVLSKFGVSYSKEAVEASDDQPAQEAISVSFGIKNFVAQSTAKTAAELKPSIMPALKNIGEGAIKLSLDLGLAQKGLAATIDAYLVPDIALSYDKESGFTFDVTGVEAYATANFQGKTKQLAISYNAENKTLAFDLAGLYELLGMPAPAGGTVYYNANLDLNSLFGNTPEAEEASNGEGAPTYDNVLDQLIYGVINSDGNILGLITGNAGKALDILSGLFELIGGAIESEDNTAVINILKLMNDLKSFKLNSSDEFALIDSEFLTELFGKAPSYYLDLENIINEIAEATDKTVEEIEELVCEYTGIKLANGQSLVQYLKANGLTLTLNGYAGETATNGLGFGIELKAGSKSIGKLALTAKFVTVSDVEDAVEDIDIDLDGAIDLNDDAAWDAFVEEMKAILDFYLAK